METPALIPQPERTLTFGVGPGIPIRSMMDMTALVASDYGINPVTM